MPICCRWPPYQSRTLYESVGYFFVRRFRDTPASLSNADSDLRSRAQDDVFLNPGLALPANIRERVRGLAPFARIDEKKFFLSGFRFLCFSTNRQQIGMHDYQSNCTVDLLFVCSTIRRRHSAGPSMTLLRSTRAQTVTAQATAVFSKHLLAADAHGRPWASKRAPLCSGSCLYMRFTYTNTGPHYVEFE
ncbi:hypothetical protein NDU88_005177 [Pleurodeles waltl]|uniref:Uncharacterized protein n=1 Tax=Pleurodeles waltl TaxID=8319 RepID=A0AAV7KZY3_PLEWA|nr:hypothetical protein NDU88_005177 [Pleurodeles waltl]